MSRHAAFALSRAAGLALLIGATGTASCVPDAATPDGRRPPATSTGASEGRDSPDSSRSPGRPPATDSPGSTRRSPEPGGPVRVMITGDLMLGRRVGDRLAAGDYARVLRPTAERLAAADLTIGNLEGTLARLGPPTQQDAFAADPRVRRGLRLAGFDVLSLANNHAGDFGDASLLRTVELLKDGGFRVVGAGRDRGAAYAPVVVHRKSTSIGILAFNAIGETSRARADGTGRRDGARDGSDRQGQQGPPGAATLRMPPRTGSEIHDGDLRRMRRAVADLSRAVDVTIVLPHWGAQYTHRPVPAQRRVGRALVDAGADAVIGGHPHWVQDAERVDGAPLLHSLGNFVFDMDWNDEVREGVVAELRIDNGEVVDTRAHPYVIGEDFAPRFLAERRAEEVLGPVRGFDEF